MSDSENMDALLGSEKVNSIERELANIMNSSTCNKDTEAFSQQRGNFSQEKEIRDFSGENTVPRNGRLLETMEMFSNEINLRLRQEMDSLISVMHSQINRATKSMTESYPNYKTSWVYCLQVTETPSPGRLAMVRKAMIKQMG